MKKNSIHLVKKIKAGTPQWYNKATMRATPVEYEYVYPKENIKEEPKNTKSTDWFLVSLVCLIILLVAVIFTFAQEAFQADFIDSVKEMSP